MRCRVSLPVLLTAAVGPLALGLLASSGANTAAADPGSGDRLGCGTFCQNAGGFGGAGTTQQRVYVTKVTSDAVSVDADGYLPVTLTCLVAATCRGAIVLAMEGVNSQQACGGGSYHWAGCSDLVVNGNSTRTIAVQLTPDALAYVRAHSPVPVNVTAVASQTPDISNLYPFSDGELRVSSA